MGCDRARGGGDGGGRDGGRSATGASEDEEFSFSRRFDETEEDEDLKSENAFLYSV